MSTTDTDAPDDVDLPDDDEEEPKPEPFRVRDVFQFRRRPAAPAPADEDEDEDAGEEPQFPPMPTTPPVVPAPRVGRAARADNHRVPEWWEPQKDLTEPEPRCEHPNPYTFKVQETGQVVPHWCPDCNTDLTAGLSASPATRPSPATPEPIAASKEDADEDDAEGQDDEDAEGDDEEGEEGDEGDEEPPAPPRRLRTRVLYGKDPKKQYDRPAYAPRPNPKQSGLKWWAGLSGTTRHGLYNGTALAAGFYGGVPQWFTAMVAHLDATTDSWTAPSVIGGYVFTAVVVLFDRATRRLLPPLALACRVPLVSLVVGVLLYGTPAA